MLETINTDLPRLMVVDDDKMVLSVIADLLEDEPYVVQTTATGYEALIKAQTFLPDLVLLDVKLEGQISGLEVCTQLKSRSETKGIPVIFISGEGDFLSESYRRGGTGFILKPFTKNDLCEVIEFHLRHAQHQTM